MGGGLTTVAWVDSRNKSESQKFRMQSKNLKVSSIDQLNCMNLKQHFMVCGLINFTESSERNKEFNL